jgi:hypothetical protein
MKTKIEERGWAGHFMCASRCSYRRNTLVTVGRKRVVVSSVGQYRPGESGPVGTIGHERFYETMAFRAKRVGAYWEADVSKQISFDSEWGIFGKDQKELPDDVDARMDKIHNAVVAEIARKLAKP